MKTQTYNEIVTPELLAGTLDHNAHTGFLEDYRVLSCLLKIHKPKTVFEVGTNTGSGVNVINRAIPDAAIFSLDLDYKTMMTNSKQYPIGANGEDRVGSNAKVPYTQLRGDSLTFNYIDHPCEAYYVDGEHDEAHTYAETLAILKCKPKLVIYHDTDMPEVMAGIQKAIKNNKSYELTRVVDTRISYLLCSR